jgi:hypothetical protein
MVLFRSLLRAYSETKIISGDIEEELKKLLQQPTTILQKLIQAPICSHQWSLVY